MYISFSFGKGGSSSDSLEVSFSLFISFFFWAFFESFSKD